MYKLAKQLLSLLKFDKVCKFQDDDKYNFCGTVSDTTEHILGDYNYTCIRSLDDSKGKTGGEAVPE